VLALVVRVSITLVHDAEHDLGPVVAFPCSDACRYLTGQTLMLDGGICAFA
jgi:NAD(P)-dependent dehydrogenase (short-subunit alcohol dehydrogenase family)